MKTYPINWKDYLLWPILRLVWTPLTGGKVSYGWHWVEWRGKPELAIAIPLLELDHTAKERTGWWSSFWLTNFGWKKVVTLQSRFEENQAFPLHQEYRIGFKIGETVKICSVVLYGPADALLGPGPVSFCAYSYPSNREILLMICGYGNRWKRAKDSTLL